MARVAWSPSQGKLQRPGQSLLCKLFRYRKYCYFDNLLCNILNIHTKFIGHKSQNREYGKTCHKGCHAVANADNDCVPKDVVVELVVAGEIKPPPPIEREKKI